MLSLWLVTAASGCSMAPVTGWKITELARDGNQGRLAAGNIRLELLNCDGGSCETEQAVVDIETNAIERHDTTFEFIPSFAAFISDTAKGPSCSGVACALSGGVAEVSWGASGIRGGGSGMERTHTFSLPGASDALWWFSQNLETIFGVYSTSSGQHHLAACSNATGVCMHAAAPASLGVLDWRDGSVRAWDDEELVGLPLMCCVCTSFEYYTFQLASDGSPVLEPIEVVNRPGATLYDPETDEVWIASDGGTGGGQPLTITRYNYASSTTVTTELPARRINVLFGGGPNDELKVRRGLRVLRIVLPVIAAVIVIVFLVVVYVYVRRRRRAAQALALSAAPKA